ncbi:helix-turn-helix domain-containing protein [Chromohalobacter israelensis]|uniref:helix-turn-helix domain-containing protein n=1 Tax=Chromohalobacter israelensis TaxID=141390 RepID=UPI00265C1663|nr:helix-turn-helix domain-containing protein [Chromohalobacter salexigens]MDO0944947.1 helix-turn-helix domain-containing protein [Chromohalobacter salexigens]
MERKTGKGLNSMSVTDAEDAATGSSLGQRIKLWRKRRGMTQLELATDAGISARHLSFLETGRSRPKRELVLKLAENLMIPPAETNELLIAAGLPTAYAERDYDHETWAIFQRTISELISRHCPYPALVLNRWADIIDANSVAYEILPPAPADGPFNVYTDVFFSRNNQLRIENWSEVAWTGYRHLLEKAQKHWGDERLQSITSYVYDKIKNTSEPMNSNKPINIIHLQIEGRTVEMISMVARFGPSVDIFISELSVNLFYPANAQTREFFNALQARAEQK